MSSTDHNIATVLTVINNAQQLVAATTTHKQALRRQATARFIAHNLGAIAEWAVRHGLFDTAGIVVTARDALIDHFTTKLTLKAAA